VALGAAGFDLWAAEIEISAAAHAKRGRWGAQDESKLYAT